LPSDITGFYIYKPDGSSRFAPGPLFGNVVLADELNRTTPRTQAAMLEAMQEGQVTIDGNTHSLPTPFMVIASQLPYGAQGTYALTEGQADRFMFRSWSEYMSKEVEAQIIDKIDYLEAPYIKPVVTSEEIIGLQITVQEIHVSEKIRDYIVTLIDRLRQDPDILLAPSTRASIALYKGARALAFLQERAFAIPDDVKRLIYPVLEHRIFLKPEAEMEDITPKTVIARALAEVAVPKE
jgi:MoxR-like ATPase